MRREEEAGVVRQVDLVGTESTILYAALDEATLDAAIAAQAAYFDALGHTVEWKLYAHDTPASLADHLVAHGFAAGDQEAIMVLDLDAAPRLLLDPPSASICHLTDREDLADVRAIYEGVYGAEESARVARLAFQMRAEPDYLRIYVAYVDGVPVSTARITFAPGSRFAGLWGGATMPAYRGRGLYTALLAARVQEARRRGARYATVDAGPMSRPIVAKLGFVPLTMARAYVRRAPGMQSGVVPRGGEVV